MRSQARLAHSCGRVMSSCQQSTAFWPHQDAAYSINQAAPWVVCAAPAQVGKPREGQLQALWWCMPQGYLLQMLSAKLGVVTGRNLAQQCRRAWGAASPSNVLCIPSGVAAIMLVPEAFIRH